VLPANAHGVGTLKDAAEYAALQSADTNGFASAIISNDGTTEDLIDLGADEYTQGKPHPMIDPAVRDQHLCEALNDGQCAVVLVDVVLGYGAHADPAGQLVRSLPDGYAAKNTQIIASVTGTEEDPQVRSRQILTLQNAGIQVADSNADAASMAVAYVQ